MRHSCAKALAVACALFVRGVKADLYEADGEYDEYDVDAYEDITQQYDDFGYGAAEYDAINEAGNSGLPDGLSYYGDEFDEYYDTYGAYGDEYGDDYSFASEERLPVDCLEDSAGKANVTGPVCDLTIAGLDSFADKLDGGLDGVYALSGCFNGRPKYIREKSPKGEGRALWFSSVFSDWDISRGSEVNQTAILVYAGDGLEETRPNFIKSNKWHVATEFSSKNLTAEPTVGMYQNLNVTVTCKAGKALAAPTAEASTVFQPLITDDEMEAKYRAIFNEYGKGTQKPGLNIPMLVFVIVLSASVVMGIPYVLNQKVGDGSRTLGQQLQESRKKGVGHVS